jgi:hypothetical protein
MANGDVTPKPMRHLTYGQEREQVGEVKPRQAEIEAAHKDFAAPTPQQRADKAAAIRERLENLKTYRATRQEAVSNVDNDRPGVWHAYRRPK